MFRLIKKFYKKRIIPFHHSYSKSINFEETFHDKYEFFESLDLGIVNRKHYFEIIKEFKRTFNEEYNREAYIREYFDGRSSDQAVDFLKKLLIIFLKNKNKINVDREKLEEITNFSNPEAWYEARKMKRKIIFHAGPTNSGKSYSAIKKLIKSDSGVYCAPLRLLAAEVYHKIKEKGIDCSLLTGDYKILGEDPKHISCTVGI
jgi:ATP-dependent RNA helicase SUPV3L1/SUV3